MTSRVLWCLALLSCANLAHAQDWWQSAVFYQVYPRSFQDSNGDGVGDLNGIASKLPHLKDLGVAAVWLSPVFKSPMIDFGYDISNFREIDPIFGTMADFDALVARAKELGIKVILDFVANHSSDEHDWFVRSLAGEPIFRDYYVWVDPNGVNETGDPIPPNNWVSVNSVSAWTYREERQQFYLHQFDKKQPDLNYRNPRVAQEMKDILTFWLDRGADGFRIDAIPHQYEDELLRDEPLSNDPNAAPGSYGYLDHIYTKNQPEVFDMVKDWRRLVDEYSRRDNITRVLMTEAYADIETTMDYYGTLENPGAHFTFNFQIMYPNNESTAMDYAAAINLWMDHMRPGFTANWVIGNHDKSRAATRAGIGLVDGLNMLVMLLPGVAVTYNGEEIGMEDTRVSFEDSQDPNACEAGPDHYLEVSRDPQRTPYQWDVTRNAGFSTADKTWLPVNDNYFWLNLEASKNAVYSHYHVYKRLVEARNTPTIQRGSFSVQAISDSVLLVLREMPGESSFLTVINFGPIGVEIDLGPNMPNMPTESSVYVASVFSGFDQGDVVATNFVSLQSKASIVLTWSTTQTV